MLSSFGLVESIHAFEKRSTNGAMLSFLKMESLAQFGVTNALHASKILGHAAKLKCHH